MTPVGGDPLEDRVRRALAEDVGPGDLTTLWTVPEQARARAVIVAKAPLVVAGMACVREVFRQVDPALELVVEAADGSAVEAETVLARLSGSTRAIMTGERTALNYLGRLSGVATLTRRFVDAVAGTGTRIVDTRKTTPGWRDLEKAAVRAGGGTNHRMGLWDMALVKDNHADASGGIGRATQAALDGARVRAAETGSERVEVEAEVRDLDELEAVLAVGPDRILLDNMSPALLRQAVDVVHARTAEPRPLLEASGNVDLERVRAVAATGVDLVSVGALTHSAPSADVSLRMVRD